MTFDARAMKLLQAGQHLTSPDFPGLRLEATANFRTWIYRYKSPVDGRMRQIKIGRWPAMSLHAAAAEWEKLRAAREAGADPAVDAKEARAGERQARSQAAAAQSQAGYTVADLCADYHEGHVRLSRARKGADEVRRMFDTLLGAFGAKPAAEVTRSLAFDLIQSYAAATPVQAKKLRSELGAAWDYAIDAGRLVSYNGLRKNWRQRLRILHRCMQITTAISAKELGLTPFFANALEVALNKEECDLIIRVETESDVLGNGVFWEGPASRVNEIRNIPARKLAHLVATDGKPRASGMWRVSEMATHPSTDSE